MEGNDNITALGLSGHMYTGLEQETGYLPKESFSIIELDKAGMR
jgi:hypothetical protein